MNRQYVITTRPDRQTNTHEILPNLGALAYASKLAEQGCDVELHDHWEKLENISDKIRKDLFSEVTLFTGYQNIKSTLKLKTELKEIGIPVKICGRYESIDGQNYSDASVIQARGIECDQNIKYALNLKYNLFSDKSIDELFAEQEQSGLPKTLAIVTKSGGCANTINCLHCSSSRAYTAKKSAQNTITEISDLVKKYSVERVIIADLMLPEKDICDLAENHKTTEYWPELKISSMANQITPKSTAALSKINCKEVFLGIETYNDNILKNLGKSYGTKQIDSALEALYQANMRANISIMVGAPGETEETLVNTKRLIDRWSCKRIKGNDQFLKLQLTITTPVPGSRLYYQTSKEMGTEKMEKIIHSENWVEELQTKYLEKNFSPQMIKNIHNFVKDMDSVSRGRYV